MPADSGGFVARVGRVIEIAEDTIHVVVAALLAVLAIVLIIDTVRQIATVLAGPSHAPAILVAILDETLLLFIVAELLHTVAIALLHHDALSPEPFLVVGMVAAIRRVLVVTAESEHEFRWDQQGMELMILTGLILVMAITALVWRHASKAAPA
ncbi:phosphate-starvation-inducible PsiE family protein [Pseudonocardia bannensis]|uniref:Phosphate-starvation-inducible protein E n=1 Tax=Pseudonocardia bannensis TaxID=630973 RepID=A0A848DI90_9PSEU|nr:phosphate-starvation-inducible PsiE family protein [Pseudonocardia bannensis]NMH92407.1 hypothetical protein [Pseudonocardia bannensis]